jgi:CheY-like chemotaxis protein
VGSTFFFTGKFGMQMEQPNLFEDIKITPPPSSAPDVLKGTHLLLVEDNPVNQEVALEILQNAGITVDVANSGAEALERLQHTRYDGILMDCQMPVMDGYEASRRIRQDGRFATLPIMAMTANAMSGDKEKCLDAGMNDHIAKPIDVNHLFRTLARWVKPYQPEQAEVATAPADAASLQEELQLLVNLLKDMDVDAQTTLENLYDRLQALGHGKAVKQIFKLSEEFEFEGALEKVLLLVAALGITVTA